MRTIAVVDDDPGTLQGLNRLLSANGFRVQTFASAESFLDDIAKCDCPLADCFLLEIHLGGISGIAQMTFGIEGLPLLLSRANEAIERSHENQGVQL